MPREFGDAEIKLQAMSYVLLAILQKLDRAEPGLIMDLLNGVRSDRKASMEHPHIEPPVQLIFDEAIKLLERANLQNAV